MNVSQKCQYALRAMFDLARSKSQTPAKAAEIADRQAIPIRFLEVILAELRQGGFVESRRGRDGGHLLARPPAAVTVGEIIEFIDGPIGPSACAQNSSEPDCPLRQGCVFMPLWRKAHDAVRTVYYGTTFSDLLEEDARRHRPDALDFVI